MELNALTSNDVHDVPGYQSAAADTVVQEQPVKPPRFMLITPDELKHRPRPRWQLHDMLVEDSIAALAGTHGTYKSFIALDWALSTAAGIDWNGREVRQGPVVYISGEGSRGLPPRIQAWERHRQTPASDDCRFLTTAVQFLQTQDIADLLAAIRSQLNEKPVLIVVDTLARALVGGDENSSRDMGMFIAALDLLRIETGACIIPIHHFNRNGTTRGSSALPAGLDTEITVERQEFDVKLICGKQKDADHFDPINLSRVIVDLGDGDSSLVFDSADPTLKQLSAMTLRVRDLLPYYFGETGATASEWKKTANDLGISDASFFRAKKELVDDLGQVYADSDRKRGARFRVAEQRVYE